MIERIADLVNADAALVRRGRFLTTDFLVEVGDEPFQVSVQEGRIAAVSRGSAHGRPWRFAIRATTEAWREFWRPMPQPGYHDLFALTRFGHARIEGDLLPFMANLRYVKEVLETPRRLARSA